MKDLFFERKKQPRGMCYINNLWLLDTTVYGRHEYWGPIGPTIAFGFVLKIKLLEETPTRPQKNERNFNV